MATTAQQIARYVPGYRVTLTTLARVGQVTLSKALTRAMGYNFREGHDTPEARLLRDQVKGEIRSEAREAGVSAVQVYASKRGTQDWLVECIEVLS